MRILMHSFTGEELMRDGVRAAQMVAWPHQSSTRVCCTREIDPLWLLSDAVWRLMRPTCIISRPTCIISHQWWRSRVRGFR